MARHRLFDAKRKDKWYSRVTEDGALYHTGKISITTLAELVISNAIRLAPTVNELTAGPKSWEEYERRNPDSTDFHH
jgi:hypothetical protein